MSDDVYSQVAFVFSCFNSEQFRLVFGLFALKLLRRFINVLFTFIYTSELNMMISSPLIRLSIQEAMPTNCTRQDAPKVLARTFLCVE